jgi:hypothetical protein
MAILQAKNLSMKVIFKPSNFDKLNIYGIDNEPTVLFVKDILERINKKIIDNGAKLKHFDGNSKRWYQ